MLAREIWQGLGAYVKGQIIVAAILSVLYAIGFAAIGLPFWYLVAPVCGLLNFIPYFGFLIGMALGALVAVFGGMDFYRIMGVILIYAVVSGIESFYLTPRIIGRKTGLRPLYVFLALLIAGSGFGFIGLLLAVPVLLVLTIVWRSARRANS